MKTMPCIIVLSFLCVTIQFDFGLSALRLLNATTKENLDKACQGITNNYTELMQFGSLQQYVSSLNLKSSAGRDFLLNLVISQQVTGIVDFLLEIMVYLVMLALAVVVLITWPFMCVCCCCNCCCFKNGRKKGTCGLVNFIIALVCISVVVIASIIGLALTGSFIIGFNGSLCSLLTFFDTAITGENTPVVPRWGGAKGISASFTTSINLIKDLNGQTITLPSSTTTTAKTTYEGEITKLKQISYTIKDPSDSTQVITPAYKGELTDTTVPNSFISEITTEKEKIIDKTISVLSQLGTLLDKIKDDSGMVKGLEAVQSVLGGFQSLVESLSSSVADNVVLLQTIISSIVLLVFFILYGLFLAIAVCSFLILLVYMLCKCYCLRFVIHAMWNIIFLLTILSFIVGCLFGILGIAGAQFVPVINYIFSSAFLNSPDSPFGSQASANLLETCINGDGDLAATMNIKPKSSSTAQLDELIQLSVEIEKIKTALDPVSDSVALPSIDSKMKSYRADIASTSPSYQTAVSGINADYDTCLPSNQVVFWLSGMQAGTVEITDTNPTSSYNCPSAQTPSIDTRIGYVKASIGENKAKIDEATTQLGTMKTDYRSVLGNIQTDLTTSKEKTIGLVDAFGSIIGDNSLYSMFNCRFMRYELINFIDSFSNKFAASSQGIGICCLVCSFTSYIGVFFLMNSIYYYSKKARELEANDSENPSDKPEEKTQKADPEQKVNLEGGKEDNSKNQVSVYESLKMN